MPVEKSDSFGPVQTAGFLLIPGFALMSYASAVEPLRAANLIAGREIYRWQAITPDGSSVAASCGATVGDTVAPGHEPGLDLLLVCAGGDPAAFDDVKVFAWLRRLGQRGVRLGGVSGGPFILARAGVMHGRHMTVHWEHAGALSAAFPHLMLSRSLYISDRDRLTCGGGIAPLDMMHGLISERCGADFARQVSDWFLHTDVRPAGGAQRASLSARYGIFRRELITALELMQHNLSEPVSRRAVAHHAGLSARQLDRLFARYLGCGFAGHYRAIRLQRARELLRGASLPVTEIGLACGFASASHFSRSYRAAFGHSPRSERATV